MEKWIENLNENQRRKTARKWEKKKQKKWNGALQYGKWCCVYVKLVNKIFLSFDFILIVIIIIVVVFWFMVNTYYQCKIESIYGDISVNVLYMCRCGWRQPKVQDTKFSAATVRARKTKCKWKSDERERGRVRQR